jgi:hypothetical protein
MNKEFNPCESKKCTIDNLHPNWKNQELLEDANSVAQQMFGVDFDELGVVGQMEVQDYLKSK